MTPKAGPAGGGSLQADTLDIVAPTQEPPGQADSLGADAGDDSRPEMEPPPAEEAASAASEFVAPLDEMAASIDPEGWIAPTMSPHAVALDEAEAPVAPDQDPPA